MASPQTEDGHTSIANELLDALIQFDLTKRQYKVLFAVIRKTYGWNKKTDDIASSQIAEMTGLDESNTRKTIRELAAMNMLEVSNGKYAQHVGLQKDYELWTGQNNPMSGSKQPGLRVKTTRVKTTREGGSKQPPQKTTPKTNIHTSRGKASKRFVTPTVEQVQVYCEERNNGISAERFIDFYTAKDWMIGKNKMKDWKAAIRTWEKRNNANSSKPRKLSLAERATEARKAFERTEQQQSCSSELVVNGELMGTDDAPVRTQMDFDLRRISYG